jgi:hypothetical protein
MFKWWITQHWPGVVCCHTPDAAGGGGGADPTGSGAASTAADTSAGAATDGDEGAVGERRTATPDDGQDAAVEESLEDLLAEASDPLDARPLEERLKALSARNKKLLRKLTRMDPVYSRVRDLDLDEVLGQARGFQEARELARTDRDGFLRFFGLDSPSSRASRASDEGEADANAPVIDLKALPFDPNLNEVNRFFYTLAEQVNVLAQDNKQLRAIAQGVDSRQQRESYVTRGRAWKSAIDTAAAQIVGPDGRPNAGVQTVFKDAMAHAFRAEEGKRAHGQRALSVEFLVNHYLKQLGISKDVQRRANDAMRQRGAERTAALPRQQTASGAPATAQGDQPFNLAAARKRLTQATA